MERLRESHPDLFTVQTLVRTWGAMNFRYVAGAKEGTRRLVRTLPDSMKKVDFRRRALTPLQSGKSLWEFPATWLMSNEAWCWQSCVVPKSEDKLSRATWRTVLSLPAHKSKAGGGVDQSEQPTEKKTELSSAPVYTVKKDPSIAPLAAKYPSGRPLREEEMKSPRNYKPRNVSGDFICWDYSKHAGCNAESARCFHAKHELIKLKGLHPVILIRLDRRGGHRNNKKIAIKDIDGHVQSL